MTFNHSGLHILVSNFLETNKDNIHLLQVIVETNSHKRYIPGTLYLYCDTVYFISNEGILGGSKPNTDDWKKYGIYSWVLDYQIVDIKPFACTVFNKSKKFLTVKQDA